MGQYGAGVGIDRVIVGDAMMDVMILTEYWPLLALIFSFVGACLIGYNHRFQMDGKKLAVWRLVGVLPVAALAWWFLPWPTDPVFYVIAAGLGIGAVVGDVLLLNAAARYGGRLSSSYVPMKMLLAFVLWLVVDPASRQVLMAEPWKMVVVLGCFALAGHALGHIRRNDSSWRALLAVVPVAVIFAGEDVVEKYVLEVYEAQGMMVLLGGVSAMLATLLATGTVTLVLLDVATLRATHREVAVAAGFGVLLMVGIALLIVTLVLSPNPGYVAAITVLSSVWLSLWARWRYNEVNSTVALLLLVVSAAGVALVSH